jgi:hyaluronan synthase
MTTAVADHDHDDLDAWTVLLPQQRPPADPQPQVTPGIEVSRSPLPTALLAVAVLVVGAASFTARGWPSWGWYGATVSIVLGAKLALSLLPEPRWAPAPEGLRVGVVLPLYNEDPKHVALALASLDAQTYHLTYVVIVDDGSPDPASRRVAEEWAATRPAARVVWQTNRGKREALANAWRMYVGEVDYWVSLDSDTIAEPDAIRQGLAPLTSDPTIAAVTGLVVASNATTSLLSRLVDGRYVSAFLNERGAYSRLGSVLCVCGSLAIWRADLIEEHIDDFVGQTFLGEKCTYGDDRHLTNLMLGHGRVVLARQAVARTAVPEKLGHFIRQQARWSRSFARESLWSLRNLSPRTTPWWLSLLEVVTWVVLSGGLAGALLIRPHTHGYGVLVDYAVWAAFMAWARSVHTFAMRRPDLPRWQQVAGFALAPLYGLMHVTVLIPLRLYALATLRSTAWGTRKDGVEVTAA